MRRTTLSLVTVLCAIAVGACAEQEPAEDLESAAEPAPAEAPAAGVSLGDFAGTWESVTYLESGDTVHYTMTATDSEDGWTVDLPDRDTMPMRVVAVAGDSVVTEMGPYESIIREGVMVTVRTVSRLQDGRLVGTMEATYAGGEGESVVQGRVEGTRGM